MTKEEIAGVLEQIAIPLELKGKKSIQDSSLHQRRARDRNVWRKFSESSG